MNKADKDLAGLGAEERANLLEYRQRATLDAKVEAQHAKRYNAARKKLFTLSSWEIICLVVFGAGFAFQLASRGWSLASTA